MVVVLKERIGKWRFLVGGKEEKSWWGCEGNWWGALGVEKALLLLEIEDRKLVSCIWFIQGWEEATWLRTEKEFLILILILIFWV